MKIIFIIVYLLIGVFTSAFVGYREALEDNICVGLVYFIIIPAAWPLVVLYLLFMHVIWAGLFRLFDRVNKGGE